MHEGERVLRISLFQIRSFHVNIFQVRALTHCPSRCFSSVFFLQHMKGRRWSLIHSGNPWTQFLLFLLFSGFIFLYATGKLWCLLNHTYTSGTMIGTIVVTCMAASLAWRPYIATLVRGEGDYSTANSSLREENHWTRLLFVKEGTEAHLNHLLNQHLNHRLCEAHCFVNTKGLLCCYKVTVVVTGMCYKHTYFQRRGDWKTDRAYQMSPIFG